MHIEVYMKEIMEILIKNIHEAFEDQVLQQYVGIPIGKKYPS